METRKNFLSASDQMVKPEFMKERTQLFILYDFLCDVKPVQGFERLKKAMEDDVPTLSMISWWFNHF